MGSSLVVIGVAFVLFLLAMGGLALGLLLRKRTPLRGSCRGVACESGGPDDAGGCRCAGPGPS